MQSFVIYGLQHFENEVFGLKAVVQGKGQVKNGLTILQFAETFNQQLHVHVSLMITGDCIKQTSKMGHEDRPHAPFEDVYLLPVFYPSEVAWVPYWLHDPK